MAIAADLLQWALLPVMLGAVVTPWDDVLDVVVAIALVRLLGWHWAFLPTFLVELVPFVDLVPTWTIAVWIASREKR